MMAPIEVERLAIKAIESALKGAKSEDSVVEFKGELVDPKKSARQIAALCNSVLGEDAIWIIGFDESRGFVPLNQELANWSQSVNSFFDGTYPTCRNYSVIIADNPVMLLHFETTLRPFVVKGNSGDTEVPWRGTNSTRNARRGELLRLLPPATTRPHFEILKGFVTFERNSNYLNAGMDIYITPVGSGDLAMPMHKCELRIDFEVNGSSRLLVFPTSTINWSKDALARQDRALQLIFHEPTFFRLAARHNFKETEDLTFPSGLSLTLKTGFAASDVAHVIGMKLLRTNTTDEIKHYESRHEQWTL